MTGRQSVANPFSTDLFADFCECQRAYNRISILQISEYSNRPASANPMVWTRPTGDFALNISLCLNALSSEGLGVLALPPDFHGVVSYKLGTSIANSCVRPHEVILQQSRIVRALDVVASPLHICIAVDYCCVFEDNHCYVFLASSRTTRWSTLLHGIK